MEAAGQTVEQGLEALGLQLPPVRPPVGSYVAYRRAEPFLYLSGQGPRDAAGALRVGKVGRDCSVEQANGAARQVGLQILASIRAATDLLDAVEAIVKLFGMMNSEPGFTNHPKVIDGCLDLLVEILGDRGRHARSAVGMESLPGGMMLEVEAVVLIAAGH